MEAKEVIIYSIKESYKNQVSEIITQLRALVKDLKGLKDIKSYHTCDNPLKLMDHVTWESLEDAKQAMSTVKKHPDYEKINAYFEEVTYFNHFYFLM